MDVLDDAIVDGKHLPSWFLPEYHRQTRRVDLVRCSAPFRRHPPERDHQQLEGATPASLVLACGLFNLIRPGFTKLGPLQRIRVGRWAKLY
jgi:hypothetical protein